jgi:hypothetical protein
MSLPPPLRHSGEGRNLVPAISINPIENVSYATNIEVLLESNEENAMTTVETIEHAVEQLSSEELTKFRCWFEEFDASAWDAQIEADAAVGKFDALAQEALSEYHRGKAREI